MAFPRRIARVAAGLALALVAACGQKPAAVGAAPGAMSLGSADAKVTLVEYASTTCPHCKNFHLEVLPRIKKDYVETGKVRYTFREYPTPPTQVAVAGMLTARCAGEAKYFQVLDVLFDQQEEIVVAAQGGGARQALLTIARQAGLTEEQFTACLSDTQALEAINASVTEAEKAGVVGTPTLFVNGRRIEQRPAAEYSYEDVKTALDAALAG
jgi:protein-disulfide isomerase